MAVPPYLFIRISFAGGLGDASLPFPEAVFSLLSHLTFAPPFGG